VSYPEKNLPLLLGFALLLLTAVLYWPATEYGFFAVDDYDYIADNPVVNFGLTWEGVRIVFTQPIFNYWIPVTWLSFMADSSLFGPTPETFHRTNVLLHALNGFLLFWVLKRATGSVWKSLAVAALFALHPLRVESVAWITARKDLVSGAFMFLCLLAWERWASAGKPRWYALALLAFLLGLMAKPVLVTLPVLLLLFDYWPLGRFETPSRQKGLLIEKAPFFALSIVFSAVTVITQRSSIAQADAASTPDRIADAAGSYAHYLGKFLYPAGLAFLPKTAGSSVPALLVLAVFVCMALITALAWKRRGSAPFLLVGWLWYVAALLPNSGIVSVGLNYLADRFTYIPLIGLSIVFVWGIERAGEALGLNRKILAAAVVLPLLVLAAAARAQLGFWQDTLAMAGRIEEVSSNAAYANELRAFEYARRGDYLGARDSAARALSLQPSSPVTNLYMAEALYELGDTERAELHFRRVLALSPGSIPGLYKYGLFLGKTGRPAEAVKYLEEALRLSPGNFKAALQLGIMLARSGRPEEALAKFNIAVQLDPYSPAAKYNLAMAAAESGRRELATEQFREYLRLSPGDADAHYNLGLLLAGAGQKEEASRHFSEAHRLNPAIPLP
jgi:Tfp pilus assembly protein PilF